MTMTPLDELLDIHARRHRAFLAAGGHYPPLHDDDDSYASAVWDSFSEEFDAAQTLDELLDIHARRQRAHREALGY